MMNTSRLDKGISNMTVISWSQARTWKTDSLLKDRPWRLERWLGEGKQGKGKGSFLHVLLCWLLPESANQI